MAEHLNLPALHFTWGHLGGRGWLVFAAAEGSPAKGLSVDDAITHAASIRRDFPDAAAEIDACVRCIRAAEGADGYARVFDLPPGDGWRSVVRPAPPPPTTGLEPLFPPMEQREGWETDHERIYDFLARGGRPEAVPIREWIEAWYGCLPPTKRPSIRGVLSGDAFVNAYFELRLLAMLHALGCEVQVEPDDFGPHHVPDFRAVRDGHSFVVEATVCSSRTVARQRNEDKVWKDLREMIREAFDGPAHSDLWLEASGELGDTLSRSKVEPIVELMRSSNPEIVALAVQRGEPLSCAIEHGEWRLVAELRPWPQGVAMGVYSGIARTTRGGSEDLVLRSLSRKAQRWRRHARDSVEPYVVALGIDGRDVICDAFGQSLALFGQRGPGTWLKKLRGISAVVFVDWAAPGNESTARGSVWQNPDLALPAALLPLARDREFSLAHVTGFPLHRSDDA